MINDLDRLTHKFRGTGRTTEQILNAPYNTLFIAEHYGVKKRVEQLERHDIVTIGLSQVSTETGIPFNDVVVDHAAIGKMSQLQLEHCMRLKVEAYKSGTRTGRHSARL